jgi:hypothetical protein
MNQTEIFEINKTIPYVDGKIYWKENHEFTSKLWENMYKIGWRTVPAEENSEAVIVQDENGRNVYSAYDRISMLRQLVNILI